MVGQFFGRQDDAADGRGVEDSTVIVN